MRNSLSQASGGQGTNYSLSLIIQMCARDSGEPLKQKFYNDKFSDTSFEESIKASIWPSFFILP